MDVILHLGAHRTATTGFQQYLRLNSDRLMEQAVGFWGPQRTRGGVLHGVVPVPGVLSAAQQLALAQGRIGLNCDSARARGVRHLIVSDENMIGTMRGNLRFGGLYCGIGERMARFHAAFGGQIRRAVLCIRAQDMYWASVMAATVPKGAALPDMALLGRLVETRRSWRDVITDLACALPGVDLMVMPFETFGGLHDVKLWHMTNRVVTAPMAFARQWANRAPDLARLRGVVAGRADEARLPSGEGRWTPFSPAQAAGLREAYADDMVWLTAGADGLARLISKTNPKQDGINPATGLTTRGYTHDDGQGHAGHLARSG